MTTGLTLVNRNVKNQLLSHVFRIFIPHSLFLPCKFSLASMQNSEVHTLSFRLVRPHVLCETNHVPPVTPVVQVPLKKLSS